MMRYNVESVNRPWCSDETCDCRRYLDGEIDWDEMNEHPYESSILLDWCCAAGFCHKGQRSGQAFRMKKAMVNSLAVLTTCYPYAPEEERFIFGDFLVDEAVPGDEGEAGYVTASPDSEIRIALSDRECAAMKFWKYYANGSSPSVPLWGTGLFRYLETSKRRRSCGISRASEKSRRTGNWHSGFFSHFCRIKGIDPALLPDPQGALMRT